MEPHFALERRAQVEEFQKRHRIGLLTLLFSDIAGSAQLKGDWGDLEATVAIHRHHATVRDILGSFSEAEEISTAGDSFFLVFAKPSDAVKFSLLLQASLRPRAPGPHILDRIGIHVGEVIIQEATGQQKSKDLYGIQVDTCARVTALASGGQILLSRIAFDSARQVLKGQPLDGVGALTWVSHSRYRLEGIEEPVEICEVGEIGKAVLTTPRDCEKAQRVVVPGHHEASEVVAQPNARAYIEDAHIIHGNTGLGYGLEILVVNPSKTSSRFRRVTLGSYRYIRSDIRYCLLPPHNKTFELRLQVEAGADGCTASVSGEAQELGDAWSRPASGGLLLHRDYLEFQFSFPFYLQIPPSEHALVRFIFAGIEVVDTDRTPDLPRFDPWSSTKEFPAFGTRPSVHMRPEGRTWIELEGDRGFINGSIEGRGLLLSELEARAWPRAKK